MGFLSKQSAVANNGGLRLLEWQRNASSEYDRAPLQPALG
jgi:hypothetical protein